MFGLGEERTAWQYDEHDNPNREVAEDVHRDMEYDTSGILQPKPDKTLKCETQFDYKYDMKGNWTEHVVSGRYEGNPEFQRSNIIRRESPIGPTPLRLKAPRRRPVLAKIFLTPIAQPHPKRLRHLLALDLTQAVI
jgi:hypothetical protein